MVKKKIDREVVERRTVLDDAKKDEMLAILVRNKEAYESVSELLTVRHVRHIGEAQALVWKVVRRWYNKFGSLPGKGSLLAELNNELKENPGEIDQEEQNNIDTFLDYAFDDEGHGGNITKSGQHAQVAIDTCRQLLEEIVAAETRDAMLVDGMVPLDTVELLDRKKAELELVNSLTSVDLGLPFPAGWDTQGLDKLFTCGVPVLDQFMGGGWQAPEVILQLGTFGSCKTVLVCHGVANLIVYCAVLYAKKLAAWENRGRKGKKPKIPVVVLIFTEGELKAYQRRLLSHMAQVPWRKLRNMRSVEKSLSKAKNPGTIPYSGPLNIGTEYEKTEFKKQLESKVGFICEVERVKRAVTLANKHLVIIDCTDSADTPHRLGKGGIPELANVINSHFRKHKDCRPVAFYLDHASALADRMAESAGMDVDEKMHLILKRMPRQAVDKITKRWRAPMAIMHQFSGDANKQSVTHKFHHAEAAGSKSVGEYVDFAFTAGKPDEKGLCVFRNTKHRREPPQSYAIVEIKGDFNRLVDRSKDFCLVPGRPGITAQADTDTRASNAKASAKGFELGVDDDILVN
jgi:hypothetical protein